MNKMYVYIVCTKPKARKKHSVDELNSTADSLEVQVFGFWHRLQVDFSTSSCYLKAFFAIFTSHTTKKLKTNKNLQLQMKEAIKNSS